MTPPPSTVRYNDWREIAVAPPEAFRPTRPVSVIVPYYEQPRTLALTLAALERQTYPRDLFEVVVVDDGSRTPLARPRSTPLDVKVVRQEDRGFGLARARNTGARAAAHDILVFLDGDMLPEAGWLAAHARWHHAAGDLLTQGLYAYVAVDGVDAETIRGRPGALRELLAGRPSDPSFIEPHLARTRDLTSRDDDPFMIASGGNLGIGRAFFELVGGFDDSFTRWGLEDTELVWRAWTRGGVVVPVRDAFAWHQGRFAEDRPRKRRSRRRQMAKVAHLIAHEFFRDARPGCLFAVPRYVVTLDAAALPAERIAETVEAILAEPVHDLVVRVELPAGGTEDDRREWLHECFGPDPRVRVGPEATALDEFPAAPFHVTLPAGARLARGLVHRLRAELGSTVTGTAVLSDGSRVSITRAWALHRARRTGRPAADFGDVATIPAWRLGIAGVCVTAVARRLRGPGTKTRLVLVRMGSIRTPRQAWWFLAWLAGAALWWAARLVRRPRSGR